ncbi:MAG: ATP-binding protein [Lachnospiraceae bacterium]|nr:ATP-binding protein [Lachnospiraceae bacterium]
MNEWKELKLPATVDNISAVTNFVEHELTERNCPKSAKAQINIAIDEIFGNIAQYAYNPENGDATVRVEVTDDPIEVILTFMDKGKPYNPLEKADPDVTLSVKERKVGGLGIFIVKKSMDEIDYHYEDGKNVLKIRKNIEPPSK